MIEVAVGELGALCGYAGTAWVVVNLAWGILRNDALRVLIYGIGAFAAIVVTLNVGGILNSTTWGIFGCCVFGLRFLYAAATGEAAWKAASFGMLLTTSFLSIAGVLRWIPHPCARGSR